MVAIAGRAGVEGPGPAVSLRRALVDEARRGVLVAMAVRALSDALQRTAGGSVYLGHAKPQNTYWYLTATPELLRKAGTRFESYADQRPEL